MATVIGLRARYGLSAGQYYPSSGKFHGSWDIPCPRGTPIHADLPGTVVAVHDGVPNNPPGRNPGSGAPSNWILLHVRYRGRGASVYYNHLSPGIRVRPGMKVQRGDLLGSSGNSGNSSGDHLHVTAASPAAAGAGDRYAYLRDGSAVYPPSLVLEQEGHQPEPEEEEDMAVSDEDLQRIAYAVWSLHLDTGGGQKQAAHTLLRRAMTAAEQAPAKILNWPLQMAGGKTTDLWAVVRGTYETVQRLPRG